MPPINPYQPPGAEPALSSPPAPSTLSRGRLPVRVYSCAAGALQVPYAGVAAFSCGYECWYALTVHFTLMSVVRAAAFLSMAVSGFGAAHALITDRARARTLEAIFLGSYLALVAGMTAISVSRRGVPPRYDAALLLMSMAVALPFVPVFFLRPAPATSRG